MKKRHNHTFKTGDILKTKVEIGSSYHKIVLNVPHGKWAKGINAEHPGKYLFYGMWYGNDPLNINSFGKIEELPSGDYEIIGNIKDIGLEETNRLLKN